MLAFLFGLSGAVLTEFCDETAAHKVRQPGIVQWWAVPTCQSILPLNATKAAVLAAERDNAVRACAMLSSSCENSNVYFAALQPTLIFSCPYSATPQTSCATFATATNEVSSNTRAKTFGLTQKLCQSVDNALCSVRQCSTDCADATTRASMKSAISQLDDAGLALEAFTKDILPINDCNTLYDKMFEVIGECSNLTQATTMLRVGAVMYALASWGMIVGMALGENRFVAEASVPLPALPSVSTPKNPIPPSLASASFAPSSPRDSRADLSLYSGGPLRYATRPPPPKYLPQPPSQPQSTRGSFVQFDNFQVTPKHADEQRLRSQSGMESGMESGIRSQSFAPLRSLSPQRSRGQGDTRPSPIYDPLPTPRFQFPPQPPSQPHSPDRGSARRNVDFPANMTLAELEAYHGTDPMTWRRVFHL